MAEKTVKIAIIGLGTVGCGAAKILLEDAEYIRRKTGINLVLAKAVDIDLKKKRPITLPKELLTDNLNDVLNDKSIQIAAELIGGIKTAKNVQLKLLAAGKDVITANKALLAECGSEIFAAAKKAGRSVAFEASCAGAIPIISALRTGLAANRIKTICGIVNGTCNYILTNMTQKAMPFADALKEAQQKGYAEADPTLDIDGSDSAHKLAILASIAFGRQIRPADIYVEGIQNIDIADIRYGKEMGYTLKLLAIGQNENGKISLRVHPAFISNQTSLARVDGAFNAVSVCGSACGEITFYGKGAGMLPTASAVIADAIEVAMGNSARLFENINIEKKTGGIAKIDELQSRFYIKLKVLDKPGVFAQICTILAKAGISLSGVLQHEEHYDGNLVPAVAITHMTSQSKINNALAAMKKMATVKEKPNCIRIVDVQESAS